MRYYLDTEFDQSVMKLISIGIVAQDGREFYAVNANHPPDLWTDQWLRENVEPHYMSLEIARTTLIAKESKIAESLGGFVGTDTDAEFWGYKCAWDIVLVHSLFEGYQNILKAGINIPLVCFDLNQFAISCGIKEKLSSIVAPLETKHHALSDARWNKFVHGQMILQYARHI